MRDEYGHERRLRAAIKALRQAGVVPGVASELDASAEKLAGTLVDAVTAEVPAFTESANPELLPELRANIEAHLAEIGRILAGGSIHDFAFVRAHAERRSEQKFPLDAILQAWRVVHKLLATRIRDAALAVANKEAQMTRVVAAATDFAGEYAGAVGTTLTSAYVQNTRLLAEAEGDRRTALLGTLLDGYDESDQQASTLLRRAGYLKQRQSYCVVAAQSVNPREMDNSARAQRIVDSIHKAIGGTSLRVIGGVRDNLAVTVVSGTRRASGWTPAQTRIADRIEPALLTLGPAVLIGLSADQPSTSHIPRAFDEAQIALEFASVTERVVPFSRLPIRRLLVHLAGERVQPALPAWTTAFGDADAKSKGALVATLRAYADADMNVLKAARLLDIHPNTVYARLQRISNITSLDGQRFHDLNEMLLAAEIGHQQA